MLIQQPHIEPVRFLDWKDSESVNAVVGVYDYKVVFSPDVSNWVGGLNRRPALLSNPPTVEDDKEGMDAGEESRVGSRDLD